MSPLPLTVKVMAQIVTVPSRFTLPVMLRRPSVAGAQGRFVPGLFPVGRALCVGDAKIQASLQRVSKAPGIRCRIPNPFLQARGCLSGSVRVEICTSRITISFVRDVKRLRISKPDSEGIADCRGRLLELRGTQRECTYCWAGLWFAGRQGYTSVELWEALRKTKEHRFPSGRRRPSNRRSKPY